MHTQGDGAIMEGSRGSPTPADEATCDAVAPSSGSAAEQRKVRLATTSPDVVKVVEVDDEIKAASASDATSVVVAAAERGDGVASSSSTDVANERKDAVHVELGFVDECDPGLLTSVFFPSKVGGRPAWLDCEGLPAPQKVACRNCDAPMPLLVQVYCGGAFEAAEDTFHRTLFVFCCAEETCQKAGRQGGFCVLRSQLPRINDFYSPEPTNEDDDPPATPVIPRDLLCKVCGCAGPLKCAKCSRAHYCSRAHQVWDWKFGGHKSACGNECGGGGTEDYVAASALHSKPQSSLLIPEMELILEEEEEPEAEKSEEERLAAFERERERLGANMTSPDKSVDELEAQMAKVVAADENLFAFRERISREPSQVLRYSRGGDPLWVGSRRPETSDIPLCKACGAPRAFELQVMPQLINFCQEATPPESKVCSQLNFGVLAVYTCSKSCSVASEAHGGAHYVEEVIWHNPVD